MRRFQSIRYFLLALLISVVPAIPAHAGVFISVGIAPPPLPVYVQPPCPEPNLMWTPGYWAFDYDAQQYYWVPGAWVPAPYEGALWTPPYWGWGGGVYMFHAGYWGPAVGYYGGVNYGFGYMGVGFVGGEWHEHHFFYNTAVINVNRTYIHNTYINNTIVHEHTIVNDNHIAYAGGPHGIQHLPTPEERNAMQVPHTAPTRFQDQHIQEARSDHQNFFNANHGRPQNVAMSRPLAPEHVQAPAINDQSRPEYNMQSNTRQNNNSRITAAPVNQQPQQLYRPNVQQPQQVRPPQQTLTRPQPQQPQQHVQTIPNYRPAPPQQSAQHVPPQQYRPEPQQSRPQPQQRAPESRPAPQPRNESRPHR